MLKAQYGWFATTLMQERVVTSIAIVGFATLSVSAWAIRQRLGAALKSPTAGALFVSLGSVLWIVGNVTQLGGHRAVGLMATHNNPIEAVNAIAFTVDMIDDAFEFAAFTMLGVGMLSFAVATWHSVGSARGWSRYTAMFAIPLLALGFAHGTENGEAANLLLVVVGAGLAPVWLLWADRLGHRTTPGEVAPA